MRIALLAHGTCRKWEKATHLRKSGEITGVDAEPLAKECVRH